MDHPLAQIRTGLLEHPVALGDRMFQQTDADLRERVIHGFRLIATREPTDRELAPLVDLYSDSLHLLESEARLPYPVEAPELKRRAFAAVASAMLNLDCVLTK